MPADLMREQQSRDAPNFELVQGLMAIPAVAAVIAPVALARRR